MANLPLPHQPDTNVFRNEVWSGGPSIPVHSFPGKQSTDAGMSGGSVVFDQLPVDWIKCEACDAPAGVGAVPALHRGAWHVRHNGEAFRFVGKPQGVGAALLQGDTTVIAAANGLLAYYDTNTPSQASVPAVSAFQAAYNASGQPGALTVDGQYGPNTQKALQNVIDAAEAGVGPTQAAPPNAWGTAPPAVPAPDVAPATPTGPGTLVLPETTIVGTPTPNYTPWIIGGAVAAGAGLVGYTYWKKHRRGHR
jgi:hypothetical protein